MAATLGYQCKLYFDTASYASPVWSEVTNCRDATLNLEVADADVTTRGNNGWKATIPTLKDASIDFGMIMDSTDTNFTTVRQAFINGTPIYVAAMTGGIAVTGSEGLWALMMVSKFTRNEQLTEAVTFDVTLKPTYSPSYPPTWHVI